MSGGGADDAVKEHGLSDGIASAGAHMRKAWDAIFSGDKKIAALGACQALYEGARWACAAQGEGWHRCVVAREEPASLSCCARACRGHAVLDIMPAGTM